MGLQHALVPADYGIGVTGLYASTRYQHVWSMGSAYATSSDGTSYGNIYGLTWTHTNAGTGTNQSIAGLSHQLQLRENGVLKCAFGTGIWTAHNITSGGQGTLFGTSNDGSGSGLDADLLDGQQGSYYAPASHNHSGVYLPISGKAADADLLDGADSSRFIYGDGAQKSTSVSSFQAQPSGFFFYSNATGAPTAEWYNWITCRGNSWGNGGEYSFQLANSFWNKKLYFQHVQTGGYQGWAEVWTSSTDGSGSGLDADLLDGQQGSYYYPKSGGAITGAVQITKSGNNYFEVNSTSTGEAMTRYNNTTSNLWYTGIRSSTQLVGNTGYHIYSAAHGQTSFGITSDGYVKGARAGTFWGSSNDGSGSGLDADLLDGQHASAFATTNGTVSGLSITGLGNNNFTYGQTSGTLNGYTGWAGHLISNHGDGSNYYMQDIILPFWGSPKISRRHGSATVVGPYDIWTSENDGSGSGLDADTVDGIQGASFLRSDASDTVNAGVTYTWAGTDTAGLVFENASYATQLHMGGWTTANSANISRMRTSSGNLHIDSASNGNCYINWYTGGNIQLGSSTTVTGSLTATGNVTAYSDIRLKEDIKPIEDAVSKIQQLTGNTYTRNDLKDADRRYGGVIAQEVEVVLPEAVSESEDGTKTVDYNALIALLVESVKELKAEVDDLKTQLENK